LGRECVIFGGKILAWKVSVADGTEVLGIDMYGRREKKVVLIIKHLFGLDIWPPCVCKRTKLIFVLYYALALGGSNAYENFGN
jgi:hypothetical protein